MPKANHHTPDGFSHCFRQTHTPPDIHSYCEMESQDLDTSRGTRTRTVLEQSFCHWRRKVVHCSRLSRLHWATSAMMIAWLAATIPTLREWHRGDSQAVFAHRVNHLSRGGLGLFDCVLRCHNFAHQHVQNFVNFCLSR